MPPKRQRAYLQLEELVKNKRMKSNINSQRKKGGSAPHEIIVQRLASEPDHKQTYKPVEPRKFVPFEYEEMTIQNLKKACAAHYHLPATSCDVLVTNKGPSATSITQIPHRKDKVYLVRFRLECNDQDEEEEFYPEEEQHACVSHVSLSEPFRCAAKAPVPEKTHYPTSVSIDALLKAGQLIKPKKRNQVTLSLEQFKMEEQEWVPVAEKLELWVETERFASGGFRDAFLGVGKDKKKWVVKKYNERAVETITETLSSTVEDHTRKQIQMHSAARHLTKVFSTKVPKAFGQCFKFNHAYFTDYQEKPATVEEYVEGTFQKYVNNTGKPCNPPEDCGADVRQLFEKAECLVHYSFVQTSEKLMLLDLQGAGYNLYDPEIATPELLTSDNAESYFCCGNLSFKSIEEFNNQHVCNKFCRMIELLQHDEL